MFLLLCWNSFWGGGGVSFFCVGEGTKMSSSSTFLGGEREIVYLMNCLNLPP